MRNKDKLDVLVRRLPKDCRVDKNAAGYRLEKVVNQERLSTRDLSPRLPIKEFTAWLDAFLTGWDEALKYSATAKAVKEFVSEHSHWVSEKSWSNAPPRSELIDCIAGFVEQLAQEGE